jgi:LysR family transcriptional regulator, flagellar master operon regulator
MRLKQHAETIVQGWERAKLEIALDPGIEGLMIGCTNDLWDLFVLSWVKALTQKAPKIAIQVEAQSPDMLSQRLINGLVDVCFLFDPPHTSGLILKHAFDTNLIMVSSEPKLQQLDQFNLQNYYMVNWGISFQSKHNQYFPGLDVPAATFSSGSMALDILLKEGGCAFLPEQMVRDALQQEILFPVEDSPVIERSAYLVFKEELESRQSVQVAIQMMRECVKQQEAQLVKAKDNVEGWE